jgi:hypothetical protein
MTTKQEGGYLRSWHVGIPVLIFLWLVARKSRRAIEVFDRDGQVLRHIQGSALTAVSESMLFPSIP